MDQKMNIYQRLAAITADLKTVAKNLTVDAGKGKYKAVSERAVLDAVKPIENKWGVYSFPVSREIIESQTLTTEGNYGKKTTFFARIKTVYRFVNVDDPKDFVETVTFAEGIDPQDKGSGKAMTYGDKYALLKMYKISTGDDPDQAASQEEKYRVEAARCAKCGNEIRSVKKRDGEMWQLPEMMRYSQRRFGRLLCADCMKTEP